MQCYQNLRKNIKVIWECEFYIDVCCDKDLSNFYDIKKIYYKLFKKHAGVSLRESFFGGRTNNLRFFSKITNDEETIEYRDVISEYPYVLKNFRYPIGHPTIIRKNFDYTCKSYFGFMKCMIIPPTDLFLPILPSRIDNKLLFHLCSKCVQQRNQQSCKHNENERMLIGFMGHPQNFACT